MEITKETVRGLLHGWCNVGLTPVRITELDLYAYKGILVYCPGTQYPGAGNDVPVWVGNGDKITATDTPGSGGFPVMPGSSIGLPCEKPNEVWVVSSQEDQKIAWIVL